MTNKPALTEEQIERIIARKIDDLDQLYMDHKITEEQYKQRNLEILEWSQIEFRFRQRT